MNNFERNPLNLIPGRFKTFTGYTLLARDVNPQQAGATGAEPATRWGNTPVKNPPPLGGGRCKTFMKYALIAALAVAFILAFVLCVSAEPGPDVNTKAFIDGAKIYQKTQADLKLIGALGKDELVLLAIFDGYVDGCVELGGGAIFEAKQGVPLSTFRAAVAKLVLEHEPEWKKGRIYLCLKALTSAFPLAEDKPLNKSKELFL